MTLSRSNETPSARVRVLPSVRDLGFAASGGAGVAAGCERWKLAAFLCLLGFALGLVHRARVKVDYA